jgi:hypothetical protein
VLYKARACDKGSRRHKGRCENNLPVQTAQAGQVVRALTSLHLETFLSGDAPFSDTVVADQMPGIETAGPGASGAAAGGVGCPKPLPV